MRTSPEITAIKKRAKAENRAFGAPDHNSGGSITNTDTIPKSHAASWASETQADFIERVSAVTDWTITAPQYRWFPWSGPTARPALAVALQLSRCVALSRYSDP